MARLRKGPPAHSLEEIYQASISSPKEQEIILLHLWKELPLWQRELDTKYIKTGYRTEPQSILHCFHSWAYLHNETVNIFSHAIGAVLFILLPFYIFSTEVPPRYIVATRADIVVCTIYLLGVAVCFCLSATFHTIYHHSPSTCQLGLSLDLQGVVLLMWGATVPLVYYGFYCDPSLQYFYWTLLTFLAVICSKMTLSPPTQTSFLSPQQLRAMSYACMAGATMIPVLHSIMKYGWEAQQHRMGLDWIYITLFFNGVGFCAYVSKFPERWYERKFDIFGASHQALHVCVVVASLTHVMGLLQAFDSVHGPFGGCLLEI